MTPSNNEKTKSKIVNIILATLLLIAVIVFVWMINKNAKLSRDINSLETTNNKQSTRIKQMETEEKNRIEENKRKEVERKDKERHLAEFYENLTLEQKVGQLFIVGHVGTTLDDRAKKLIKDRYVGGFCLYKRNAESLEQTYGMIQLMQNEAIKGVISKDVKHGIPLFIAGDNEPGRRWMSMSHLVKPIPLAKDIPVNYKIEDASKMFSNMAKGLAGLGYNVNFAPITDVNTNKNNPIIGDRAFSTDVDTVSEYAAEFIKQYREQGMIERMKNIELKPFRVAIDSGSDMIMTAHVIYDELDKDNPATLSKYIISDILRDEMGFNGIVITDDMYMGAILESYDQKEALVKSINAGVDILLCVQIYDNLNSQEELYDFVLDAVKTGKITQERLKESVMRILRLKSTNKILKNLWGDKNPVYLCDK